MTRKNTVLPPLITETNEYHEVCGCCEKDIQCDMMQKAVTWKDGNTYDSLTKWKMKWDYGYKPHSQSCSADSFKITADIIILLPKWVCSENPTQSLRDRWDDYIRKLTAHENGHRDIAKQAVEELTEAVAEMPPTRTCGELDRQIQELCRDRMRRLDAEQQEYDSKTGHGFENGPTFP